MSVFRIAYMDVSTWHEQAAEAVWKQLHNLLRACCHALNTNINFTPVAELILCAFLNEFNSKEVYLNTAGKAEYKRNG